MGQWVLNCALWYESAEDGLVGLAERGAAPLIGDQKDLRARPKGEATRR